MIQEVFMFSSYPRFLKSIMDENVVPDSERIKAYQAGEFIFPDTIELHLGLACQCSCVFCWRWQGGRRDQDEPGDYRVNRSIPTLTADDITELITSFRKQGGKQIYFSGGLEFFTSPHALHAIQVSRDQNLRIRIYTNGLSDCFDESGVRRMILDSAEYIRFSVHANSSESFRNAQMPNRRLDEASADFQRVRDRIAAFVADRRPAGDGAGQTQARIGVSFLALGYNYGEIEDAIEFYRDHGVDSFFIAADMRDAADWFDDSQRRSFDKKLKKVLLRNERGDFAPMTVRGDRHEPRIRTRFPSKCFVPYKHPAIDPWGHVYSCCYRVNPSQQFQDYNYGKFPESGLFDILRRAHDQGRIPRPQCAQCPDWELGYNQCVEEVLK
jgi:MoaA/NifB/PqqE/SkfB family radical SAM enzyme